MISASMVLAIGAVGVAVLTVLVFAALHATSGWRGLLRETAVYMVALCVMAALTVLVIMVVRAVGG